MARRRLRPLVDAGRRCLGVHLRSHAVDSWAVVFLRGRLFSVVLVRFHSPACVSIGGRPPSLVGGPLCSCAVGFVGGRSCSCGGAVESWWSFVMEWLVVWLVRCVVVLRCCL